MENVKMNPMDRKKQESISPENERTGASKPEEESIGMAWQGRACFMIDIHTHIRALGRMRPGGA